MASWISREVLWKRTGAPTELMVDSEVHRLVAQMKILEFT